MPSNETDSKNFCSDRCMNYYLQHDFGSTILSSWLFKRAISVLIIVRNIKIKQKIHNKIITFILHKQFVEAFDFWWYVLNWQVLLWQPHSTVFSGFEHRYECCYGRFRSERKVMTMVNNNANYIVVLVCVNNQRTQLTQ